LVGGGKWEREKKAVEEENPGEEGRSFSFPAFWREIFLSKAGKGVKTGPRDVVVRAKKPRERINSHHLK